MGNPFKKVWQVFSALNYSKRTLTIIGVIAIAAILPVTVFLSQQQQEIRQRASEITYTCRTMCPPGAGADNLLCKKTDGTPGCEQNLRCCSSTTTSITYYKCNSTTKTCETSSTATSYTNKTTCDAACATGTTTTANCSGTINGYQYKCAYDSCATDFNETGWTADSSRSCTDPQDTCCKKATTTTQPPGGTTDTSVYTSCGSNEYVDNNCYGSCSFFPETGGASTVCLKNSATGKYRCCAKPADVTGKTYTCNRCSDVYKFYEAKWTSTQACFDTWNTNKTYKQNCNCTIGGTNYQNYNLANPTCAGVTPVVTPATGYKCGSNLYNDANCTGACEANPASSWCQKDTASGKYHCCANNYGNTVSCNRCSDTYKFYRVKWTSTKACFDTETTVAANYTKDCSCVFGSTNYSVKQLSDPIGYYKCGSNGTCEKVNSCGNNQDGCDASNVGRACGPTAVPPTAIPPTTRPTVRPTVIVVNPTRTPTTVPTIVPPANCDPGTSKNPYKCSNNACARITSISCEADACNPADTNACKPSGGSTMLALTLGLDGIGTTGDNANPTLISGSNKNPGHPSRSVSVVLVGSNGQALPEKTGQVTYDGASGSATFGKFKATIDLGTITTGSYTVKVTSPVYLTTLVSSMATINSGTTNTAPAARLTTGNINDEGLSKNTLDIMDYNILLGCVRDETITNIPAAFISSCNSDANNATLSDLDDNASVDRNDWNLWIRELGHQLGAQ